MFKLVTALLLVVSALQADDCAKFYDSRGESESLLSQAISCYQGQSSSTELEKIENLNKLSYLVFLKANFYGLDIDENLVESYELAKSGIEMFAPLFEDEGLDQLSENLIDEIALAYYLYGTAVSQYIDRQSTFIAIQRKGEITRSMTFVIKLKRAETFHYGAYRTLAIYYLKVPAIAGGSKRKSEAFFNKLFQESTNELGVLSYPVGHYFYAGFLEAKGDLKGACAELDKMINLSLKDIQSFFNTLIPETLKDQETATERYQEYGCAGI